MSNSFIHSLYIYGGALQLVTSPVIQGNAWNGGLLLSTEGSWKDNPVSYSFQWKKNGTNIGGAVNQYYIVSGATVGDNITCEVTVTDVDGKVNSIEAASVTVVQSYEEKVLSYSPIAYWPLSDASGSTLTALVGEDGTSSVNITLGKSLFKSQTWCPVSDGAGGNINIYSTQLNSVFDGAEGSISIWLRGEEAGDWSASAPGSRAFNLSVNNNNRLYLQHSGSGIWAAVRFAGGTLTAATIDMSDNPVGWVNIIITWSETSDELIAYRDNLLEDTGNTLGVFTGSLSSTQCTLFSSNTSNDLFLADFKIAHFKIFDSVVDSSTREGLSIAIQGKYWHLNNGSIFYDLRPLATNADTAHPQTPILYDIDNDGEMEVLSDCIQVLDFVAMKANGTALWQTTVNNTSTSLARHSQIYNGVMYASKNGVGTVAIRLSDGEKLWEVSGSGKLSATPQGLVRGGSTTIDILDYETGVSIGGNFPYTLGFSQNSTQTLSSGDLGDPNGWHILTNDTDGNVEVISPTGIQAFTIDGNHTHVDWAEFVEIGGTKYIAVCVSLSGDPVGEGDELHLYNVSGTSVNSYTAPYDQIQFRYSPSREQFVVSCEDEAWLAVLDNDLNVVVSSTQAGLNNGEVEWIRTEFGLSIFTNTGENSSSGFTIINPTDLIPYRFFTTESGVELTDNLADKGWPMSRSVWNKNQGMPREFLHFIIRDIGGAYWHKFTLEDIP